MIMTNVLHTYVYRYSNPVLAPSTISVVAPIPSSTLIRYSSYPVTWTCNDPNLKSVAITLDHPAAPVHSFTVAGMVSHQMLISHMSSRKAFLQPLLLLCVDLAQVTLFHPSTQYLMMRLLMTMIFTMWSFVSYRTNWSLEAFHYSSKVCL